MLYLFLKKNHPGAIAVFAFDNSSSRGKYAEDALNANHMKLNPGEKRLSYAIQSLMGKFNI